MKINELMDGIRKRDLVLPEFQQEYVWNREQVKRLMIFDTALLQQSAQFRAEVIVHELLHLKVLNHGKLFKALYRAFLS